MVQPLIFNGSLKVAIIFNRASCWQINLKYRSLSSQEVFPDKF